jgi:predicted RNA-binding protein YlxR (DUF448 family)
MAKNLHLPTRTCVSCRGKYSQNNLLRIQCRDGEITHFIGNGRSFYFCDDCLSQEKKIVKALMRQCRGGDKDKFMNKLKEIIVDERKS